MSKGLQRTRIGDRVYARWSVAALRSALVASGAALVVPCLSVDEANAQAVTNFQCLPPGGAGPLVPCGSTAVGANTGDIAANSVTNEVQDDLESIRKKKYKKYRMPESVTPIIRKGEPAPVDQTLAPGVETAIWANGSYQHDNQSGFFMGANLASVSHTWGGLGGADITFTLPSDNYLVLGGFAGDNQTFIRVPTGATAVTKSPLVGAYGVYIFGDWSADLTYTHAWLKNFGQDVVTPTCPGAAPGTCLAVATAKGTVIDTDSVEGKLHYRFKFENNWYAEPVVGFMYQFQKETMGLQDMRMFRVEGGAMVGTLVEFDTIKVEPTFTGMLYSDVSVKGGFPPGGQPIATNQGQAFLKGIAKCNVIWTDNFSTSLEGQVYGSSGLINSIGYRGAIEARLKF